MESCLSPCIVHSTSVTCFQHASDEVLLVLTSLQLSSVYYSGIQETSASAAVVALPLPTGQRPVPLFCVIRASLPTHQLTNHRKIYYVTASKTPPKTLTLKMQNATFAEMLENLQHSTQPILKSQSHT
jgi:hypothetical protein